uniref:Uncharacterized protein n=1 Tax=Oryza punctata TaxID=4537 RepID=A0A0E0K1N0_ORYPU
MASNKAFVVFALLMLVAASAFVDVASGAEGGGGGGKKCGPCKCKGCCDYDKCISYCSGDSGPCCKWKGKCHGCCS